MIAKAWMLVAAAAVAATASSGSAQSMDAGLAAWNAGRHDEAVRNWQPLAERGDADAQFSLGHAYRLGRGVPQDLRLAEQWYGRAARGGHDEAAAMYGLILFQNGRRQEAMPFIQRGAEFGDPRAQYVLGTALFNGDLVGRDWPRAYAYMSRAAAQGLPPATAHLQEMDRHLSAEDKQRGLAMARQMEARARATASAAPPPSAPPPAQARPPRVAGTAQVGASEPVRPQPAAQVPVRDSAPAGARPAEARTPPPTASVAPRGWRVQLGAFSTEANARRQWEDLSRRVGALSGMQPYLVRAGNITRLQAGPVSDRAAAERACAAVRAAGQACFTVAP